MGLPDFDEIGDLPPGVHHARLGEVVERFGTGSVKRKIAGLRLQRVFELARATGQVARFLVFGSFVTAKADPNDVDVFMLMEDTFDCERLVGDTRLLFEHAPAQAHFGASVFWLRRLAALGGEASALEQWQITREGWRRGIVEVTLEGE